MALIRPLSWELPYASGAALKKKEATSSVCPIRPSSKQPPGLSFHNATHKLLFPLLNFFLLFLILHCLQHEVLNMTFRGVFGSMFHHSPTHHIFGKTCYSQFLNMFHTTVCIALQPRMPFHFLPGTQP